jgi:hypothetical protein
MMFAKFPRFYCIQEKILGNLDMNEHATPVIKNLKVNYTLPKVYTLLSPGFTPIIKEKNNISSPLQIGDNITLSDKQKQHKNNMIGNTLEVIGDNIGDNMEVNEERKQQQGKKSISNIAKVHDKQKQKQKTYSSAVVTCVSTGSTTSKVNNTKGKRKIVGRMATRQANKKTKNET